MVVDKTQSVVDVFYLPHQAKRCIYDDYIDFVVDTVDVSF